MKNIFQNVDIMENLNPLNRKNWEFESNFLVNTIKPGSNVLQIGCTLGDRLIVLWNSIKPVRLWGIDIDSDLINRCRNRLNKLMIKAELSVADAQKLPDFDTKFNYVICLNNTLGYIPDDKKAISEMKKSAKGKVIISIYTDTKFTDKIAKEYFKAVGSKVRGIENNVIRTNEISMKRYSIKDIRDLFGKDVQIIETPLGVICMF